MNTKDTCGLLASVVKWAAIIGSISFAGGFIGPIFLSSSNLGPLLDELETRQQQLKSAQIAAAWDTQSPDRDLDFRHRSGISLIAVALNSMFRDS